VTLAAAVLGVFRGTTTKAWLQRLPSSSTRSTCRRLCHSTGSTMSATLLLVNEPVRHLDEAVTAFLKEQTRRLTHDTVVASSDRPSKLCAPPKRLQLVVLPPVRCADDDGHGVHLWPSPPEFGNIIRAQWPGALSAPRYAGRAYGDGDPPQAHPDRRHAPHRLPSPPGEAREETREESTSDNAALLLASHLAQQEGKGSHRQGQGGKGEGSRWQEGQGSRQQGQGEGRCRWQEVNVKYN
jgi:hypothetical protein